MRIIVTLDGPDAKQALNELMSNIQYDKLKVRISIKKEGSNENRTETK